MDILLVGGSSQLMKKLCLKLHKEGHRVYVLTDSKNPNKQEKKVFETYHFSYDSTSIREVFKNLHPDVSIFMGAYDGNYLGSNEQSQGLSYLCALQNLLLSWSAMESGRLIFLSSVEVFAGEHKKLVSENDMPTPKGYRSMMLYQAEQACLSYAKDFGKDVIVLRLDWLYDIPRTREEASCQICALKCLDAFYRRAVSYRREYAYGLTYLWDAVLSIYELIICKKHEENLYHISSSRAFSEEEIAKEIQKNTGYSVELLDDSLENPQLAVLDHGRIKREFGFFISLEPEQMIEKTMDEIRMHTVRFLEDAALDESVERSLYDRFYRFLYTARPYMLNMLVAIGVFVLNLKFMDASFSLNIPIYLLYVLAFALACGQRQALLSSILSGIAYLFIQLKHRLSIDLMTDYTTYIWMIENFVLGLLVGHMKDQLKQYELRQEKVVLPQPSMDIFEEEDKKLMEDRK